MHTDLQSHRGKKITVTQLRERWGCCSHMTIERRIKTDADFPKPFKLGGRLRFFDLDEIERYERLKASWRAA
jgi:predicted DNA-binding transcriptional regulator AlpA